MSIRNQLARAAILAQVLLVCAAVALILAALGCLGGGAQVSAQELPIALKPNSPLSPGSAQTYQNVADDYKESFKNWRLSPEDEKLANRAKLDRNRLIFLTVDQIDTNFAGFQKKTRTRRAFWATLLDILEIGASTAISLSNGERAKTEIAEALGFVQLARAAVVKNFSLRDTQILFNKMVSKRAQILGNIIKKTAQKDVAEYPFELSFSDLIAYYKAGTIDGALESLNIDTGAEAGQETARIENLKIATAADLKRAESLDELRTALFVKARDTDPAVAGPAIDKLRKALKGNLDLVPGKTATEIDGMNAEDLDKAYRTAGQQILIHPEKLQKLIDALK